MKYTELYGIKVLLAENVTELIGTVFMVDGDIYGPKEKNYNESLLFKLKLHNAVKISLTENVNYKWVYNKFINHVDHFLFANKIYAHNDRFISPKNLYIGNTKYDNVPTNSEIYQQFNLEPTGKYVTVLYPKHIYVKKSAFDIKMHLEHLYKHLRNLGYTILVKLRPKENIGTIIKGDHTIVSEVYPNETLQLLKISELCILFSSSAVEEAVMMHTPTIDFDIDTRNTDRLPFLKSPQIYHRIDGFPLIDNDKFLASTIDKLEEKNSPVFDTLIRDYLFTGHTSKNLINILCH